MSDILIPNINKPKTVKKIANCYKCVHFSRVRRWGYCDNRKLPDKAWGTLELMCCTKYKSKEEHIG